MAPPGALIYAIGDIHGRMDLLEGMLKALEIDAEGFDPQLNVVLVLLGDYIDRGPESWTVIDVLVRLRARGHFTFAALRGNHEQAFLDFLEDPLKGAGWLEHGGLSTLASYGIAPRLLTGPRQLLALRDALLDAVPQVHLEFLENLPLTVTYGDYFFCHAGVRPGVGLQDQKARDLLWIREAFIQDDSYFDKVIVHGHTIEPVPVFGMRRIGLDSGAYTSGVLTAARLVGSEQAMIQVRKERGGGGLRTHVAVMSAA